MKRIVLSGVIVVSSVSVFSQQESGDLPNILVFVADDAGMDFGCYGNRSIKTPNIDRLASHGLRFEKAFLTSPQSSPSRTGMMTGKFAHTIGTEDLHSPIDDRTLMIPYFLRQKGYFTGSMLKTHWGENGDKQFDCMIDAGYDRGTLTEKSYLNYERFIRDSGRRPFFLWIGFSDPHRGYNRKACPQVNQPEETIVPPFLIDEPNTRRDLADYYDEISRMDANIGRMLQILHKNGKEDNTLIIFLSDNGMPFPRCKGTLYDMGIRTPLVFVWKNKIVPGGVHNNGLISTIDLAPTLLDVAGIPVPSDMYGTGFKDILFNPVKRGREYIFSERNWHNTDEYIRCVRTETRKLIYNAYYELPHGTPIDLTTSPSWYELKKRQKEGFLTLAQGLIFTVPRPMVEIYDLTEDTYELHNVADEQRYYDDGMELAKLLREWQSETGDHPWWKRRRPDQNDRITGFPLFSGRQNYWTE
ncbi:heparan N-sulfatase [Bacteroidia bacterium]|nr:heparan N-sulfatase [Bacteroidia bacterium]